MKETKIEVIQLSKKCQICKLEIKGYSESQVDYNLKIHTYAKHKEEIKHGTDNN
ncbi:MAG: hypothetical protein AABY22_12230 [Nanoarchaeota archaeon]